jgi:hypothetical protein
VKRNKKLHIIKPEVSDSKNYSLFEGGNSSVIPIILFFLVNCLILSMPVIAQKPKPVKPIPPISLGTDGKLVYTADSLGNRIPDFSYCGYMAGEQPLPYVPAMVLVPRTNGDATYRIQDAIDYIASLPADKNGFRGAVLLEKGTYEIWGQLSISAPGIVLRGSGMGRDGTILLGEGKSRQTLIAISGKNDRTVSKEIPVENDYVPVNTLQLNIQEHGTFKTGDMVIIRRPSTQKWIEATGTGHFGGGITALGWKEGDQDILWDRKIVSVSGKTLTLDAPLTTALDKNYGGGTIAVYKWPGRISHIGIENLICRSAYETSNPKDEDHRWMAITLENVYDAWVRQVVFEHFASSAVAIWETAKRVTVEDCKSLSPVSEIGGQRRNTFWTTGQQILFQRLYSEYGYHDFAVGYCAPGPNAFVQCEAFLPYSFSGSIDSWASGVLFDIVSIDGNALCFKNLGQNLQGAGWNAANSVFWQCSAARVDCYKPPTANNWAFGTWAQFSGDGYWGESNNHIKPRSLYYAQLADRLGESILKRAYVLQVETEATSSPTVEMAMELTAKSVKPQLQLVEFIDQAPLRQSIPADPKRLKVPDVKHPIENTFFKSIKLENGWLTYESTVLTGSRFTAPWWSGNLRTRGLNNAKPAITRFVPGRTGTGLTDNLAELTDSMVKNHVIAFEQNYALWYDRRRDDHERIRRMDGDVWPPFYELPFARSGQGIAWDGLSLFDLTSYNHWYWARLREFSTFASRKGLVLINHNYFQHNIIEAGAHWTDFPWRSANNINHTGFPEPPPYAGDKRIFMAEQFYDTAHIIRKELHKAFIRQNLNNFPENSSVIQFISAEFTGPFYFVKFWLETIRDWENETGRKTIVGLSVTKDVQDSILGVPELASIIDVIDIRYWAYRDDGSIYAPKGGQNLAPRQHARLVKPGKRSFKQTYRAVREYKQKFPEKAIMYSEDGWDRFGWAVFMAGGSLACISHIAYPEFLTDAAGMKPYDLEGNTQGQCALSNPGKGYIIYNDSKNLVKLDLSNFPGNFIVRQIDPSSGSLIGKEEKINGGKIFEWRNSQVNPVVLWISKI